MEPRSQAAPVAVQSRTADPGRSQGARPRPVLTASSVATTGRVASIDALRGFDMFWIVGGQQVVVALAVLAVSLLAAIGLDITPYLPSSEWFHNQMDHARWEGFTAWDLIMPLFLFIVGAAMPFSFVKRIEQGQSKGALYRKVFRRVVILWILGTIAQGNLLQFDLGKLHLYSNTLQAIAAGYLVAAVALIHLSISLQVLLAIALLVGYWLIMLLVPVPGVGAGILEEKVNLALYVDQQILGRFRDGTTYAWILGSMGFAGTVLLGVFSGHILRGGWKPWTRLAALVFFGGFLLALGWFWSGGFDGLGGFTLVGNWRCPIIKHLFTSSMVLWACGWSCLLLALFYLVIDMLGFRRWSFFFVVIGANAIFAYMIAHLGLPWRQTAEAIVGGLARHLAALPEPGPAAATALVTVAAFAILWLILLYMYRKGTLIRV